MIATAKHNTKFKPLFPYFGGKSSVAGIVWAALGDVNNYVEPFFGSGAVLFLRPGGAGRIETVNDADGLLANFWRAMQRDSAAVAKHADNPVNECDLHARHLWLLGQRERITERLCGDDKFFDAQAAGYWAWGMSCWIGSDWCSGNGPWIADGGVMTRSNAGRGVNRQLPHLGDAGRGVNRKRPHLSDAGQATPALGQRGAGSQQETPGECAARLAWLKAHLAEFADRLRNVRVCCGDWSRVCTPAVTHRHGLTGVFVDPPYADTARRRSNLYAVDCESVAHDVREWAIENGKRKDMRIVLAGYEGEHKIPRGWRVIAWKAQGGYGNESRAGSKATGEANAHRERLWLSPACLKVTIA